MKHTELPWRVFTVEVGNTMGIQTKDFNTVVVADQSGENKANAAFIVKACNSFYGLLEALENVDDFMNGHDDGLGLHQVVIDAIKQAKENES